MGCRNVWKKSVGCPNCLSKPSDSMPLFCCWQLSTQNWGCRAGGSLRAVRIILWGGKEGIRHSGNPPSLCSLKGTQGRRTSVDLCSLSMEEQRGCSITCLYPRFLCPTRISCPLWDLWLFLPVGRRTGALAKCLCSQAGRAQDKSWVPAKSILPQSRWEESVCEADPGWGQAHIKHWFDFAFWHGLELSPAIK